MDRLLRDTPSTLERKVRDAAQNLVDIDSGSMVVTIRDSAGTLVVTGDATRTALGTYQYVVTPTVTANLDKYEVLWEWQQSGARKARSHYEVVGAHFFSLTEMREDPRLADTGKFTDRKLVNARERAEDLFERECNVAMVPKGRRVELNGGRSTLLLPDLFLRRIVSISVGGVALTQAELDELFLDDSGIVTGRDWTAGTQNVSLYYEYGLDFPPEPAPWLAMKLAIHYLVNSAVPDRAISLTSQEGTMQMANTKPTGLADVDAFIADFAYALPGVG